jgi:hypothetical protein
MDEGDYEDPQEEPHLEAATEVTYFNMLMLLLKVH